MNYPVDFSTALLNLEIDFGDKGGIQRFKTVGDLEAWLNEEKEFWSWMNRPPANHHHSALGNTIAQFDQYDHSIINLIQSSRQQWQQIHTTITQLRDRFTSEDTAEGDIDSIKSQIEQCKIKQKEILDQLQIQTNSVLTNGIVNSRNHISRLEPCAQFICDLADSNPEEAIFALDQFILDQKNSSERRSVEHTGRMMASLYLKNLNRKVRTDRQAFEKAIVTWGKELADFKSRYETQESEFTEISKRHEIAETEWKNRADEIAENFAEMRSQREQDLNNLTETYETHMQLKGPLIYWRNKRREHNKGKFRMGFAAAAAGLIGAGILVWATQLLLPISQSYDEVPWRSIGLFVLISTFVLWIVRLFVKLMLSHIHLYADAREREVMISTFMALVRRQESREGISKMDLALVLAPIFKPSTTGVIQDDGGPTTLTDFIGRLSGK